MPRVRFLFFAALVSVPSAAWPQGDPLGLEFRVNTYTTGDQRSVFGRRYASSGTPLGSEFLVNSYTTYSQGFPSVAADSSGGFVVFCISPPDGSIFGIFGQRYASSGAPLGLEFRVNTYTTSYQAGPAVAANSSGNFVVVWQSQTQDGSGYGVFGQRYAPIVPVELMHFRVDRGSARTPAKTSGGRSA